MCYETETLQDFLMCQSNTCSQTGGKGLWKGMGETVPLFSHFMNKCSKSNLRWSPDDGGTTTMPTEQKGILHFAHRVFIEQCDTLISHAVWIFISPQCFKIASDDCLLISSHSLQVLRVCQRFLSFTESKQSGRTLHSASVWLWAGELFYFQLWTWSSRCLPSLSFWLWHAEFWHTFLHNN